VFVAWAGDRHNAQSEIRAILGRAMIVGGLGRRALATLPV